MIHEPAISKWPVLYYCWPRIVKDVLVCFYITVVKAYRWISCVFWSPIQKLLFNHIHMHGISHVLGKCFPQQICIQPTEREWHVHAMVHNNSLVCHLCDVKQAPACRLQRELRSCCRLRSPGMENQVRFLPVLFAASLACPIARLSLRRRYVSRTALRSLLLCQGYRWRFWAASKVPQIVVYVLDSPCTCW